MAKISHPNVITIHDFRRAHSLHVIVVRPRHQRVPVPSSAMINPAIRTG
jgi:hypothetical protein